MSVMSKNSLLEISARKPRTSMLNVCVKLRDSIEMIWIARIRLRAKVLTFEKNWRILIAEKSFDN